MIIVTIFLGEGSYSVFSGMDQETNIPETVLVVSLGNETGAGFHKQ